MQLSEMIERAGFPVALRDLLDEGTLVFYHAALDGTLCFQIPKKDETKSTVELVWHPADPALWHYEGLRFYVFAESYHDRDHLSVAGSELIETGEDNDVDDLVAWIAAD